ncbi:hypothetical protein [Nannocystis punicea]|uniref:Uncharacterized protein n=1 Tax=Nannocystis punicea TaxID=2995304 RepID=A0ABY7GVM6_9BACT|nr:hypothetical protein [Nannocystis poenicansa]WAS91012.1 hypothetical protein O0S08_32895 [Nannocystis poenicansa]
MNHCIRIFPISSLLFGGCVLTPEVIGESLSTDGPATNVSASSAWSDTDGNAATSATSLVPTDGGGPAEGEYGAPCELELDHSIEARAVSLQPDCDGGICLFQWEQQPPWCADDSDCEGPWSTCNGTRCVLDQEFVVSESFCTSPCDGHADCPPIPGCGTGAVCVPLTTIGDLCCQKTCACADLVDLAETEQIEQDCAQPDACGA